MPNPESVCLPEETATVEPKTDGLELKVRLLGSFDELYKRFEKLQIFLVSKSNESVKLLHVESRDMQKRPFIFILVEMQASRIIVEYTIALGSSPKIRRLFVLKALLNILSLASDLYSIDNTEFFQYVDSAIDDVLSSMNQSYSQLFNSYDALFSDFRETKKLNIELSSSNKNLTVKAMQLNDENKQLTGSLKELEIYSDNSLMVMLQDWIMGHDGVIDVNEFAKNYKMTPTRVEQMLNKMVTLGYIELRG